MKIRRIEVSLLGYLVFALAASASATTYDIDADHSAVTFRIRHLVGKVSGRFDKFAGTVDYEKGKPASWKTAAQIDPATINTNNGNRDKHLRDADFFDVAKCPRMFFQSARVEGSKLFGDLTMHCATKPVVLDLEVGDEMKDPMGNLKLGATATGKINRKDFGISWNKALDAGGLVLGDEVDVTIDIEAAPKKRQN